MSAKKSDLARKMSREVQVDQYLDTDGVLYLWQAIKSTFVTIEPGKGLSTNDFTDALKTKLEELTQGGGVADSVAWEDITNKPTNLVTTPVMNSSISEAIADLITQSVFDTTLMSVGQRLENVEQGVSQRPTVAQVDQKIANAVSSVYRFMGSVGAYTNLPTSGMQNGDVYNVEDTDMNYAWVQPEDGSQGYWDPLGTTFKVEPIPNSVLLRIVEGTYGN